VRRKLSTGKRRDYQGEKLLGEKKIAKRLGYLLKQSPQNKNRAKKEGDPVTFLKGRRSK